MSVLKIRELTCVTRSEDETRGVARRLARKLKAGDAVCLFGPLGVGKTRFVQGLAMGLGHKGRVVSPTFALAREYQGRKLKLYHLDLFRLTQNDLALVGWEDFFSDPKAACAVEWAENAGGALPEDRLEVRLETVGRDARRINLKATGPFSRRLSEG